MSAPDVWWSPVYSEDDDLPSLWRSGPGHWWYEITAPCRRLDDLPDDAVRLVPEETS